MRSKAGHLFFIFLLVLGLLVALLALVYFTSPITDHKIQLLTDEALWRLFFLLIIVAGVFVCLYVLAGRNKNAAIDALQKQNLILQNEIINQQKTARQLARARESADAANQSKTRYLSGVSHELRTPLNTIFGYAQLLAAKQALPEKLRDATNIILHSCEHLSDVIEGLLEISKIEARRLEYIHSEPVNIRLLVEQIIKMFESDAKTNGIDFNCEGIDQLPVYVSTDQKRLRQILINLISNAIKFTQQGSVLVKISYRNEVAKFFIEDTGTGIKPEDQQRIFEPFERLTYDSQSHLPGTGLGLSISRLLAELMGGDIALESQYGAGSRFTLSILLPKTNHHTSQPIRANIVGYHGQRKTLLVVDDEENHRHLISDLLSPLGFSVLQAADGYTALQQSKKMAIDLYLLDIAMPKMSGWELANKLKEQGISAPVFMLSGNAIENDEEKMKARLYDEYLIKPIHLQTLLEKIGSALELRWQYDVNDNIEPKDSSEYSFALPDNDTLEKIKQMAAIGYLEGIKKIMADIEKTNGKYAPFKQYIHPYISQCDLAGLIAFIEKSQHDTQ